MTADVKHYGAFLHEEKWISKMDFIYLFKTRFDCSEEHHGRFLQFLYRLSFHSVTRSRCGKIIVR